MVIWTWVGAVEGKWAKLTDIGQRLNQSRTECGGEGMGSSKDDSWFLD